MIYSKTSERRFPIPPPPDEHLRDALINKLHRIRELAKGEYKFTPDAEELYVAMYCKPRAVQDYRFEGYWNRRFPYLIKLCIIIAASNEHNVITKDDLVEANTYLSHAENLMPKALGEFGKSRHSEVTHKIMSVISYATDKVTFRELWVQVVQDLEKQSTLVDIMQNLILAKKVKAVDGGYLPVAAVQSSSVPGSEDHTLLTREEKET